MSKRAAPPPPPAIDKDGFAVPPPPRPSKRPRRESKEKEKAVSRIRYEEAAARLSEERRTQIRLVMQDLAASPTDWDKGMAQLEPQTDDDKRYIALLASDTWTREQRKIWYHTITAEWTDEDFDNAAKMIAEEKKKDSGEAS